MNNIIELLNVSHSFNRHKVLDNINLTVTKGEIIGLLGPSGAGKTTLIKIMTGQLTPDYGKISVNGMEMYTRKKHLPPFGTEKDTHKKYLSSYETEKDIHKNLDLSSVGIMMDNWGLYDRFSVYDNLKFYASIFNIKKSRINELLIKTGLADAKKVPVCNLSKGMKSRVNFCRALLKDINILVLDEPTSGLDPTTTNELHNMILEQKNNGTTIFLTTHNMYEAQKLCNNVALLNNGKIVEYGEPFNICKRYNHLNKIIIERRNGENVIFNNNKECAQKLTKLIENEDILTIHSTEPDLEKVFLELTGRKLS